MKRGQFEIYYQSLAGIYVGFVSFIEAKDFSRNGNDNIFSLMVGYYVFV